MEETRSGRVVCRCKSILSAVEFPANPSHRDMPKGSV